MNAIIKPPKETRKGALNGPKSTGEWVVKQLKSKNNIEIFICRADDEWATASWGWFGPSKKLVMDGRFMEELGKGWINHLKKAAKEYCQQLNSKEDMQHLKRLVAAGHTGIE